MLKYYKFLVVAQLILLIGYTDKVHAAQIDAANCSRASVQAAVDSANVGDTVVIPSGNCSWSSNVVVDKAITIKGQTTTSRNPTTYKVTATDRTTISQSGFKVTESNDVRITGITFNGMGVAVLIPKPAIGMRIDHCHFNSVGRIWDKVSTAAYQGILFDNNRVTDPGTEHMYINGGGNASWALGGTCGSSNYEKTTLLEDNEWVWISGSSSSPIDSGNGARIVFRHNRFTGSSSSTFGELIETHGHCWGQRDGSDNAGTYCMEISDNKMHKVNPTSNAAKILKTRSGKNYVYNNELYDAGWSTAGTAARFWVQEVTTECNTTPCAVQAHEDMGLHPAPLSSGWNATSYPAPMQPNNSYVWGNTWDKGTIAVDVQGADPTTYCRENRDYWDDLGNGDSNFNSGLSTLRSETCSVDDSYWESDTWRLYRCTSANTWNLVFKALDYPHPLRTGEDPSYSYPPATSPPPDTTGAPHDPNRLIAYSVGLNVANVSASNHDGNIPANTLDNDIDTRWSSFGDGQWIEFDLGVSTPVSGADISFYIGDQRTNTFSVEVSQDRNTWTEVFNGNSSGATYLQERFMFTTSISARYVRIIGSGNSSNSWNSITEVDIF